MFFNYLLMWQQPLRLFVCRFLQEYAARLFLVLDAVDRLPIWIFQKSISPSLYGTNIGSYIGNEGGACYMKHREFVYVGEPIPELNEREHAAFLINIQRSILLSLEKRNLLTASQRERCLLEIEKQHSLEIF